MDGAFDTAIIGGGAAGLSLAILLAKAGKNVVVFEKERYPFHKVRGEYLSSESLPFLRSLGVRFEDRGLPQIDRLLMSSPAGLLLRQRLDIGGIGVSRYLLDEELVGLAKAAGVAVREGTAVTSLRYEGDGFRVISSGSEIRARTVAGSWGKGSRLDVQLGRNYRASGSNLLIAVEHHIRSASYDPAQVELHNFDGGYCGMSALENGKTNLSYICRADKLKAQGSIEALERNVLSVNPMLRRYFSESEFLFERPLTISHLSFGIRGAVSDHILLLGDSAGAIPPLSGNGMSMAFRSASLAAPPMLDFLDGRSSRPEMEEQYASSYKHAFSRRVAAALQIHRFFGKPGLTDACFAVLGYLPGLRDRMGRMIRGDVF